MSFNLIINIESHRLHFFSNFPNKALQLRHSYFIAFQQKKILFKKKKKNRNH